MRCGNRPHRLHKIGIFSIPLPHQDSSLVNFTSISLRFNFIRNLNISILLASLPKLTIIDVRDNDALLCQDLSHFSRTAFIQPPPLHQAAINPVSQQNHLHKIYRSPPHSSQAGISPLSGNPQQQIQIKSNQDLAYIYAILISLVLVPSTIILSPLVMRYWKSRQLPRRKEFQLTSLIANDEHSDSDESIIFTRETVL